MRFHVAVAATIFLVASVGCQTEEAGPSYADLVMIYNSEAEALDRLEAKRAARVAEYEATLAPSGDAALAALGQLLGDVKENPPADLSTADPDELLDNAIANAENLDAKTNELLEAAAQSEGKPMDRGAIEAMYSEEFKAELATLDAEIATQQARVDKARANRDAAEK
jgi:hypothetical protein